MKNKYEIRGEVTAIFIKSKKHGNFETLIDTDDLEKVKEANTWYVNLNPNKSFYVNGYIEKEGKRQLVRLHRHILGVTKPNKQVDHIYQDTLDNRKSFLRLVNPAENNQNKPMNSNNTSGITGVTWDKRDKSWIAQITVNYKNMYLGNFRNKDQAKEARLAGERKYFHYKNYLLEEGKATHE